MPIMEQRKRILKMVEDGKLTAEEALTLLENLEKEYSSSQQKEDDLITELSTNVQWSNGQKSEEKFSKSTSVKHTILDFVDKAFKKIKDFDLDFNFGTSLTVKHIFQHSEVYLKDIEIDVANGSIKLSPWDESDVRLECDAKVYQANTQEEARKTFLESVIFSIEGSKLRYSVQKKKLKVNATMFLPKQQYDRIMIRLFNGRIDGEKLYVDDFKAKTANGKITVGHMTTERFEVETANGHITATNLVSEKVEAETINGTIKINGSFKSADIQSFNGNVICSIDKQGCESVFVKTTTGNVDLYVPNQSVLHGELKTNIGSFQVDIPHIQRKEEKSDVVLKYLRFVTQREGDCEPLILDVDTKTGSVIVKEKGVE